MRRRRRNNTTLMKTMGIAVLITAAILPIMAWLGVFKAVKQKYYSVSMVTLPPPKPLPQIAKPHHKKVASKSHTNSHENEHKQVASRKPLPAHVATSAAANGNGTGPSVVNGTNTEPIGAAPTTSPPAPTQTAQAPVTTPPPPTTPPVQPVQPVAPVQPATPPAPTVVDAQVVTDPKPAIPEDLLDSDLDTNFWALFTIHADGTTDVKMVQSTGNQELDSIAMQCARQWKFRPATKDGQPVDSYERLQVEFQVS